MLGVLGALLAGVLVLFGFGQALGARGHVQRAADLAAVSAGQVMRRNFARLFEPPYLERGLPNPRHLSNRAYLSLARAAAQRGVRRNGVSPRSVRVAFAGAAFAPTRVTVSLRDDADVRLADREERLDVGARATAEIAPDAGGLAMPLQGSGGGYSGPLAYRQGKPMRPDVARAFDRMAAAARKESGLSLLVTSGYRSDAEQARLFAAHPDPKWVAPPGTSLHRYGTELDLGPPAAYAWLAANSQRFGFVKRYPWEPWHYGYTLNAGTTSVGFGGRRRRRALGAPVIRAGGLPGRDRAGGAAMERRGGAAGRAAVRRVGLQPLRAEPGRGGGDRAVHARDGRRGRARQPVRPGRRHRRPSPPDARPAAAVRPPSRSRWPPTTPARAPSRAACASRPSPRRAPTWRRSSACLAEWETWPPDSR